MTLLEDLATKLGQARLNPSLVQSHVFKAIDTATGGTVDATDPATPFATTHITGGALFSAAMQELQTSVRQQYPLLAADFNDLNGWMADVDYLDRFATPAGPASFMFMLGYEKVLSKLVPVGDTGVKQMIIPRNTEFTVNGYTFTLQYPIVIKQQIHGSIDIYYDTSSPSPIQTLESNLVEWDVVPYDGVNWLRLTLPLMQVKMSSVETTVTTASTVAVDYQITSGSYYHCRCWGSDGDGVWTEYATTHSGMVRDNTKPTIVLSVKDKTLSVRVPQIYITSGIGKILKVVIYTTAGELNMDLASFVPSAFGFEFKDHEASLDGPYTAAVTAIQQRFASASGVLSGGANGLTFAQQRRRTITNSTVTDNPITPSQIETALERRGFDILTVIDDLNLRTFVATRSLTADDAFTSGVACSMPYLVGTLEDLAKHDDVVDNGDRITLTPSILYRVVDGKITLVPKAEADSMRGWGEDAILGEVNRTQYLYSPFYYVWDTNGGTLAVRSYYFSDPSISSKQFVRSNDTTQLSVNIDKTSLVKTDTGFTLTITVASSSGWKELEDSQCHCMLGFSPRGETAYAFKAGVQLPSLVDGERSYQFDITTGWDTEIVNSSDNSVRDHYLIVDDFTILSTLEQKLPMPLRGNWDIAFAVSDYDVFGMETSELDAWIGKQLLPDASTAVARHRLFVSVGDALDGLWANARNTAGSVVYDVWQNDVMDYYDADESVLEIINGQPTFTILHRKGDPVMVDGVHQVKYKAGTTKTTPDGKPVTIGNRKIDRQAQIMMLDGCYYFATYPGDVEYQRKVAADVVGWIKTDITFLSKRLLENTTIRFYPKTSIGNVAIAVDEGREITVSGTMSFDVTFYMSLTAYTNLALRDSLESMTSRVINTALTKRTVAVSDIISKIVAEAGGDIIGVDVSGFGPDKDISTFTAVYETGRCAVKRELVARPEGVLRVAEAITFAYVRHRTNTVDEA